MIIRQLLIYLLLVLPAWCEKVEETCSTKLSVVAFELQNGDREFTIEGGKRTLRASTSSVLEGVDYKGSRQLRLFRGSDDASIVASVRLPESSEETIVILLPGKTDGTYRALAVRASLKDFPRSSRLLYNLSTTSVRGQLGGMPFNLGSKANTYFMAEKGRVCLIKKRSSEMKALDAQPVRLEYQVADDWRILANTRWFHTPRQRHLIFVYYDGKSKNLILRGVTDTLRTEDDPAVLEKDDEKAPVGRKNIIKGHPILGGDDPEQADQK